MTHSPPISCSRTSPSSSTETMDCQTLSDLPVAPPRLRFVRSLCWLSHVAPTHCTFSPDAMSRRVSTVCSSRAVYINMRKYMV